MLGMSPTPANSGCCLGGTWASCMLQSQHMPWHCHPGIAKTWRGCASGCGSAHADLPPPTVGSCGRRGPDFPVQRSDLASRSSPGSQNFSAKASKLLPIEVKCSGTLSLQVGEQVSEPPLTQAEKHRRPEESVPAVTLWPSQNSPGDD